MDFATGVYLSVAQNAIPLPPCTMYMCIIQYTYSHREGGERRVEPERQGVHSSQSWVENTNND
jgi:hypothetical protein